MAIVYQVTDILDSSDPVDEVRTIEQAAENIKQSVQKIFEDNYLFFTGSLEYSEIFYKFHALEDLKISDFYKILRKSFHIVNKIVKLYDSNHVLIKTVYMYSVISYQIIKSIVKHYLRKIFK
jgi:hypothetical protein